MGLPDVKPDPYREALERIEPLIDAQFDGHANTEEYMEKVRKLNEALDVVRAALAPTSLATEGTRPTCDTCGGQLLARARRRLWYCRECKTNVPMKPPKPRPKRDSLKAAGVNGLTAPEQETNAGR